VKYRKKRFSAKYIPKTPIELSLQGYRPYVKVLIIENSAAFLFDVFI